MKKLVGTSVIFGTPGEGEYVILERWDDGSVTWREYTPEDEHAAEERARQNRGFIKS